MEKKNMNESKKEVTYLEEYLKFVPMNVMKVYDYVDNISNKITTADNLTTAYLMYEAVYKKRKDEVLPSSLGDIDNDFYAHLKSVQGVFALGLIMGRKMKKNDID